jgi:hypothetical protein
MINGLISALWINLFVVTLFNCFSHITHMFCTFLFQDLYGLFTPLTNEEENEVNSVLYGSGHRYLAVMHSDLFNSTLSS